MKWSVATEITSPGFPSTETPLKLPSLSPETLTVSVDTALTEEPEPTEVIRGPEYGDGAGAVHVLPKKLEEKEARLHPDAFGAERTKPIPEQAKCIGVEV